MTGWFTILTLATWLTGKFPDAYGLLGIPLFWWARTGKLLQIGAGLIVVVDLLASKRLKAWAERAFDQAAQRSAVIRIITLRDAIDRSFRLTYRLRHVTIPYGLNRTPPNEVPPGVDLTLDAYRDRYLRIVDQVLRAHTCRHHDDMFRKDDLCREQQACLRRNVDELLVAQLPPHERPLVGDVEAARLGRTVENVLFLIVLLLFSAFLVGVFAGARDAVLAVLMVSAWLLASVARVRAVSLAIAALWYGLQNRLAEFLSQQAEASPPFRRVKLLALWMFLVGALLDLLAS